MQGRKVPGVVCHIGLRVWPKSASVYCHVFLLWHLSGCPRPCSRLWVSQSNPCVCIFVSNHVPTQHPFASYVWPCWWAIIFIWPLSVFILKIWPQILVHISLCVWPRPQLNPTRHRPAPQTKLCLLPSPTSSSSPMTCNICDSTKTLSGIKKYFSFNILQNYQQT